MNGPELPDLPSAPMFELAALGAMLLNQDALDYGLHQLSPRMFSSNANRLVFIAMKRLRAALERGDIKAIGPIETAQEMHVMGRWKHAGEAFVYASSCADYCHAPQNFKHYVDTVRDKAQLRSFYALGEFMALGEATQAAALQPDADPRHVASCIANCLNAITRDGYVDVKAVFEKAK